MADDTRYSERYIVSCILLEPHRILEAVRVLSEHHFLVDELRAVYRAQTALAERRSPLDVPSVAQEMDAQALASLGGWKGLVQLIDGITSTAYFAHHLGLLTRRVFLHDIRRECLEVAEAARRASPTEEAVNYLRQEASTRILAALDSTGRSDRYRVWSQGPDRVQSVLGATESQGVVTGLKVVDEVLGGLYPAELILVASRPGAGKSSFALSLCYSAMRLRGEMSILFFSLEMDRDVVADRFLSFVSGVPYFRIHRNKLTDGDKYMLQEHAQELRDLKMTVLDNRDADLYQIRSEARRCKMESGLDLVVVDYLQLLSAPGKHESRRIEVGKISRGLRSMAKEFSCPVVALAQLKRESEEHRKDASDSRPRLSDLRESGDLEQDADSVVLLHRPGMYSEEIDQSRAEVLVAKNRHGKTGMELMDFHGDTMRFRNAF